METGKTILSTSAGRPARLTLICSSSPSPSPVTLSPVCTMVWSGVDVEVGAGGGADVPAEADRDGGKARCLLGERDVAALGQAYCHGKSLSSSCAGFVPSRKLPSPVITQAADHEVPGRFTFFANFLRARGVAPVQKKVTDGARGGDHGCHVRALCHP